MFDFEVVDCLRISLASVLSFLSRTLSELDIVIAFYMIISLSRLYLMNLKQFQVFFLINH